MVTVLVWSALAVALWRLAVLASWYRAYRRDGLPQGLSVRRALYLTAHHW